MFAMVLKTLKKNTLGTTIVEILLTLTVISLLILIFFVYINPVELKSKTRDEARLADLQTLDRAINEYFLENEEYPGAADTTLTSSTVPTTSMGPPENAQGGWIGIDMSKYFVKMPIDPLNDTAYRYLYRYSGASYELNATLEVLTELMQTDGGNSADVYEIGNNLTVL